MASSATSLADATSDLTLVVGTPALVLLAALTALRVVRVELTILAALVMGAGFFLLRPQRCATTTSWVDGG